MTWGQLAVNALAAILLVVGTWVTARFSRKTGEEANTTDNWDRLLARNEAWQETQQKRIDRLEAEVRDLRTRFDEIERKYRMAVEYIRRLVRQLRLHVEPEAIETPPPEIYPDL